LKELPTWVVNSVGIYALLGSAFFLVLIILTAVMVRLMLDLNAQVKQLTKRVQGLTDRVQGIADQVSSVTTEVGSRATGIARLVDEHTGGAIRLLEIAAPVLFVIGAVMKIRNQATGRARRRR
jgi:hypothetical protein